MYIPNPAPERAHRIPPTNIFLLIVGSIYMKNIGVLRDTARAPKPISQKHAIPCNAVIRYHKIPYHT